MSKKLKHNNIPNSLVAEPETPYGFRTLSEDDKLKIDMHRSDAEKLSLFTKMLRRNGMLNKVTSDISKK